MCELGIISSPTKVRLRNYWYEFTGHLLKRRTVLLMILIQCQAIQLPPILYGRLTGTHK